MFWLLKKTKTKKGILGKKNIWHKFLSWKKMVEGESSTRDSENWPSKEVKEKQQKDV